MPAFAGMTGDRGFLRAPSKFTGDRRRRRAESASVHSTDTAGGRSRRADRNPGTRHGSRRSRLDAAERLIDIVSDAAAMEGALGKTDIRALKRDAFRAILDTEAHHLQDKDLMARMKSEVSKL